MHEPLPSRIDYATPKHNVVPNISRTDRIMVAVPCALAALLTAYFIGAQIAFDCATSYLGREPTMLKRNPSSIPFRVLAPAFFAIPLALASMGAVAYFLLRLPRCRERRVVQRVVPICLFIALWQVSRLDPVGAQVWLFGI